MKKILILLAVALIANFVTGCSESSVVAVKTFQMEGLSDKTLGEAFADYKGAKSVKWESSEKKEDTATLEESNSQKNNHRAICRIELYQDMLLLNSDTSIEILKVCIDINKGLKAGKLKDIEGKLYLVFAGTVKKEKQDQISYTLSIELHDKNGLKGFFLVDNYSQIIKNIIDNKKIIAHVVDSSKL